MPSHELDNAAWLADHDLEPSAPAHYTPAARTGVALADLYTDLALAEMACRRFDVNVSAQHTVATTARGTSAPRYRFTAAGNGIGAATVEGEGPSAAYALTVLLRALKVAYYAHRDELQARQLARRAAALRPA